ncbi:MAG: CHAT domain-containing protein [Nitrospirae bacterium]|nr:CHAT domain-containing protein [Nitrospirota bacterium]
MDNNMTDIDKILAEREKIDSLLKSKFSRAISIMFTDIKGSTSFYESRGDIDGRVMVHRHNEIVLPLLKEFNGELLKTIGDATMTVFDSPSNALGCAIAIQRKLREVNKGGAESEHIHVRIGLNYGTAIVDKGDVFGDVVNVASRVESLADAGEIFITEDMYREVRNNDEFIFRFVEDAQVKGKKKAIKVYRVVWHEEALSMGITRTLSHGNESIFVLEASISGQKLKISGYERAGREESPVKGYKEINFNEAKIKEYTSGVIDLLNRANRRGKISSDLLVKLKDFGRLMFDELIPVSVKDKLIKTRVKNLMVNIDDSLVFVPWELLFDGKEFLCRRFSLGRSVSTKQQVSVVIRALGRPLKMQLLADPGGDLKASYEEGVEIKNEISALDDWVDVTLKSTDIRTDYVKAKIRNFDIVHYAGHAEHDSLDPENSGWVLKDGMLRAEDIKNMRGAMPMPSLVFSNACKSGHSEEWKLEEDYEDRIFGLANAFLLAGVQHYIGTFWEIPDEAGSYFAIHFYKYIAQGSTIGEAMRKARVALINKYGEDTIVWAGYMLYGDPTTAYVYAEMEAREKENKTDKPVNEATVSPELRHKESVIQLGEEKKSHRSLIIAGIAVLLIAAVAALFFGRGKTEPGAGVNATVSPAVSAVSAGEKEAERKRIDELVASLAKDYRADRFQKKNDVRDEWNSMPITMVFMDVKSLDGSDESNPKKLLTLLPLALQEETRFKIVEREILDKLLQELKLSQSDLSDPLTSLRIGKLFSARLIMSGTIIPDRKGLMVISKFIDTETSQVVKVINTGSSSGEIEMNTVNDLGNSIAKWISGSFPLRGKVLSVSGGRCRINLGQIHGLKKGDRLKVIQEQPESGGIQSAKVIIEIGEVEKDSSFALVTGKPGLIKQGDRIREIND